MRKPNAINDALHKMFASHRSSTYSIGDLRKSFTQTSESLLNYYITKLRNDKIITVEKRGFYKYNPEYKTPEEIRAEIAKMPPVTKIVQGEGWAHGQPSVVVVDLYWSKLLKRSLESMMQRMLSPAPAMQVFTQADIDMLTEISDQVTRLRTSGKEVLS